MSMNVQNSNRSTGIYTCYKGDKNALEAMKAKMEEIKSNSKFHPTGSKEAEVTLSNEGMKNYLENILKTERDALHNAGVILTDYNSELGSRLPSSFGEKNANGEYGFIYRSVSEQAEGLLRAYAGLYDEIQKGYAAGVREAYVEDKASDAGYRKLTMEEELAELDKAFQFQTKKLEKRNDPKIVNALAENAKKLAKAKASGNKGVVSDAAKELEKRKTELEELPELGKRLFDAAKLFKERYGIQKPGTANVTDIVSGISIYGKK